MIYSIDVENNLESMYRVLRDIEDFISKFDWSGDWKVSANAGGIDYGVFLNIDIINKRIEISNQANNNYDYTLDEVLEMIEDEYGDVDDEIDM